MMKKAKNNDLVDSDEQENQGEGKSEWQKPSLSFIGKLKEIVRGSGTSPITDGASANYRVEK